MVFIGLVLMVALWIPGFGQPQEGLEEWKAFLGINIESLVAQKGLPQRVEPRRGAVPREDDVVFQYQDGLQVGIYSDRVWKLSFPLPLDYDLEGLLKQDPYLHLLWEKEGRQVYQLQGRGFPIRLSVDPYEEKNWVHLYRGDL